MKSLAAAAAFLLAAPIAVEARPQWIQVAADGSSYIDFNTVSGNGSTRSVIHSVVPTGSRSAITTRAYVDCNRWQWTATVEGHDLGWQLIGKETVGETIAELICR